MQNTQLTTEEA